ncbi:tripartite motif-containing protein 2-like [Ptychodera flava]|uniref:tripartite motif-containing protein 2-like n=1 Tax=Ptychodera flava TaxID=63121 RepID=UPI00396A6382
MSHGGESIGSSEDGDDTLSCPVCKKKFDDPKILPCLHTVCSVCLDDLVVKERRAQHLVCPVKSCREKVQLTVRGVHELPDDFSVNNLADFEALRSGSFDEIGCGNCDDDSSAECWCSTCTVFLCKACTAAHERVDVYRSHELHLVAELQGAAEMSGYLKREVFNRRDICPICAGKVKDPKLLPCNHTACLTCLKQLVVKGKGGGPAYLKCPSCEQQIFIPAKGVGDLPSDDLLVDFDMLRDGYVASIKCGNCADGATAECWCSDCGVFVCENCRLEHRDGDHYSHHKLFPMSDLQKAAKITLLRRSIYCKNHERKEKNLYCVKCDKPICEQCKLLEHRGKHNHFTMTIDKAIRMKRIAVNRQLKRMRTKLRYVEKSKERAERDMELLVENHRAAKEAIHQHFENLMLALERCKERLENKLEVAFTLKDSYLYEQQKSICDMASTLQHAQNFTERVFHEGSDVEILTVSKQISERLDKLLDLPPIEESGNGLSHLKFEINKAAVVQYRDIVPKTGDILTFGRLPPMVVPPPAPVCSIRTSATVLAFDDDHRFRKLDASEIRADIKDQDSVVLPSRVLSNGDSTFDIRFRPQIPGRHVLTVRISGRPVKGNPFTLDVAANNPIVKFGDRGDVSLNEPIGIAVDSRGNVIVADPSSRRLVIYDDYGDYKNHVDIAYSHGSGVAVDQDDNIINVEWNRNHVHIYSPYGELVREFTYSRFVKPYGVAVSKDNHILVADSKANCIFVFSTQGDFIKQIGEEGGAPGQLKNPGFLAVSKVGNIAVSDFGNSRIVLFKPDGSFLRHMGSGAKGRGLVRFLGGLAIDAHGNVLAADGIPGNRIQVFSSNGSFVSSIESEEDKLSNPHGIALAGDGLVLVADTRNKCIKKYRYM